MRQGRIACSHTIRLNPRRKLTGHVFGRRYKAQLVEGSGSVYLRTACEHVCLNPVRPRMLKAYDPLWSHPWSSLSASKEIAARMHLGASKGANSKLREHMRRSSPLDLDTTPSGSARRKGGKI